MKKKGAVSECADERARDIMQTYDRCIAECRYISILRIYEQVARSPARRFFVSPQRAASVVSAARRGKAGLSAMREEKREMFKEIIRRVESRVKDGDTRPLREICKDVVAQPAPRFYLAAGGVKTVVSKFRKEWNREKRAKLPLSLWR